MNTAIKHTFRSLRTYQSNLITASRQALHRLIKQESKIKSVMFQLATGGGKTRIFANITNSAINKPAKNGVEPSVWVIAPRIKLVNQASKELKAEGVEHGKINADSQESRIHNVHVCSRETLSRRIKAGKIKRKPTIVIIDEAHTGLKFILMLIAWAPEGTLFLGFTATPERLSGEDLTDAFKEIVYGPPLIWLVENGYLKHPKCYEFEPLAGVDDLKMSKDGNVSAKKSEAVFQGYRYGREIENYKENALGRSFLVFCASITLSKLTAAAFTAAGIRVEHIDGEMKITESEKAIAKVETGELDGLTSVELVIYGLDVPKLSCIIMLRKTDSRALYFQMLGRGLRPQDDFNDCLIFDHVGNIKRLGHPLRAVTWNFNGNAPKQKAPKNAVCTVEEEARCPACWDHYMEIEDRDGNIFIICRGCGAEKKPKSKKPLKIVDGHLVEITGPEILINRDLENQRKYQDAISQNTDNFRTKWLESGEIDTEAVHNLCQAAYDLKRRYSWVFYKLCFDDEIINTALLQEIANVEFEGKKKYKPGWLALQIEQIEIKRTRK